MLLTKIWTTVLAVLATACLAGMLLLSTGSSGGFTEADETAVRAVTEAGMAALESDINSSPVSLGPSLLSDTRLKEALEGPAVPEPPAEGELPGPTLQDVFVQVANEGLLNEYPRMSMAIADKNGNILARTGLAPELFDELVKMTAMDTALGSEEAELLSSTLGGKLHAVKLSRPLTDSAQRRLITIRAVELGAGSFFRRVVGTDNPAGLVRDGKVLGDAVGEAKVEELIRFTTEHTASIPPEGASGVFAVGDGASGRIGSAARVPGPAGKGKSGTLFIVLSKNTWGSTQQDMAAALQTALDTGGLAPLYWLLVIGLLLISLALTFYLPFIDYNGPLRRLSGEFHGITEGRQHELYHDTYGGELGALARAATTAMEALRVSWENELMDSDAELSDVAPRRTRSTRSLRAAPKRRTSRSRAHKSLNAEPEPLPEPTPEPAGDDDAIDLPSADASAPIERHASADAPPREAAPPAPAPAFQDDIATPAVALNDNSDSVSFADVDSGVEDRENYYRGIYDEFVETKGACGEPTEGFTYEKFAKKLRKQSDTLLGRADVTDVQFSVYVKDGKAALRAKIIKG